MNFLILISIVVLLAFVVVVVGTPLRATIYGPGPREADEDAKALTIGVEHDELEAAREAKYREIRDAELDFRTGKLSREDYEAIDAQLRGEALDILDRLGTDPAC